MSDLNRQLKAVLPHLAGPISSLLASMPRKSSRNALIPSIVGVASAGVLVGVAIGLLVAPQNGKEMRRQLGSAASSFRHEVIASLDKIASSTSSTDGANEGAETTAAKPATRETENGGSRRSSKTARA